MRHSGRKLLTKIAMVIACFPIAFTIAGKCAFAGPLLNSMAQPMGVTWLTDLDSARDLSRRTGKPILVDFSATWCGPCQAMAQDTFPDPAVRPLLKNLICVHIDVDADTKDATQFQVNAIPRILLLTSNAASPARMDLTGYEDPDTFAENLRSALGLPPLPGAASSQELAPNSPAEAVADALASNKYMQMKAKSSALALLGLRQLIAQLGQPTGSQIYPLQPALLSRAGDDGRTALESGMANPQLAERAGAYAMFRQIVRTQPGAPAFDPWAPTKIRKQQLPKLVTWANKKA